MATEPNIDADSEDLWELSSSVLDNYNEEKALKHLTEKSELRTDRHTGFDNNSGDTWIYPTNYTVRKYQHDIVYNALFKNTLVCLPTGLGKTFIAAVVMYNFYRWYPQGKLIFMAPTKPLVAQQIEACYQIMGISKEDTAEITGQQKKENRLKHWKLKRVFYGTPQSVVSDIDDPNFPIQSIKLVVIDEAHKAKGKYAYCEVIRIIKAKNEMFRVLALSATPGRSSNDVAEVVHNLLISHIEMRTEKCSDVVPYVHRKQINTIVIKLTDKIQKYRDELIDIIDPYVRELIAFDVITGSTNSLHRGWLVVQKQKYVLSCQVQTHPRNSEIMNDFSCCLSLYHGLELLERHGLWPFVNFFDTSEQKFIVAKDHRLRDLLTALRADIGPYPFANGTTDAVIPPNFDFGHPKYDELHKCLSKHLRSDCKSQAIVFCEFRDSAFLIHQMLIQKGSDIKPAFFVGQGSTNGQKGITQKQQIATMADFRKGTYNVLIATCVAEEGIDCGEVDLIVCFDVTSKNPTRLVQRMGRTGRKRNGTVCLLVTEGKEHSNLKESMKAKEYTLVTNSNVVDSLCKSPRLVPSEFDPKCVETFIQTDTENQSKEQKSNVKNVQATSNDKRSTVQPPSTSADLRNFFQPISTGSSVHKTKCQDLAKELGTESNENINERLKVPTFWDVIADERTSSALKAFAIKRNVYAWKDQFTSKTLSPLYESVISNTINDPQCISNLINSRQYSRRASFSISELDSRNEPFDSSYSVKLIERFAQVRKRQQLNVTPEVNSSAELPSQANNTSLMDSFEPSQAFVPFYDEIESKYEVKYSNETKMFGCNSPVVLKRTPMKSSTPLASKKVTNKSNGSIKDSPLARAFEKCKSLNRSKNKRKKSTLDEALAFFGLKDVMDIFDDPLEDAKVINDSNSAVKVVKIPTHSEKASECRAGSNRDQTAGKKCSNSPSTSFANQTSQYTVSQILRIVNVTENVSNREKSDNSDSSVKDKSVGKEIYIGTIEEIFGCSDDVGIDQKPPNESPSASEEDEVIASSQPVIPKIKLPSKYLSSTENKRTSNHPECPSNGEDMFASFSNISSPMPSHSNESPIKNRSNDLPSKITHLPSMHPTTADFKSPSPNNSKLQAVERSPSVFRRKINLSRLKALSTKSNSERIPSNNLPSKSPLFFSCNNLDVKHSQPNNGSGGQSIEPTDNGSQFDDTFQIHRNPNKRNRVINDTIFEEPPSKHKNAKKSNEALFKQPKKPRLCNFIDDECEASDGSSDEFDLSSDADLNSIICNEEVNDDTSVDMRAIYLQSVKSPVRKNGVRFSNPAAFRNNSNIFSQAVIEDNESDYDTSFVVDECSEDEGNEHEMSVLERAEWLLKMKRREKRKICNNNSSVSGAVPKRRKIIEFDDSSDENI